MKEYYVRVTQQAIGYYDGIIIIKANSEKEAKDIVRNMTQNELDNSVEWELGDEFDASGDIRIESIEEYENRN